MAASSSSSSNAPCRFFLTGGCRQGDNCRYSHNPTVCVAMSCRFFARGHCSFGDKCRFRHEKSSGNSMGGKTESSSMCRPTLKVSKLAAPLSKISDEESKFTTLKRQGRSADSGIGDEITPAVTSVISEEWVNAPEFVPANRGAPKSYAEAAGSKSDLAVAEDYTPNTGVASDELCPFAMMGNCQFEDSCPYIHGLLCELCNSLCLHPDNEEQRKLHTEECIKQHEKDMEHSFAVARSQQKSCGICMENVLDKNPTSARRFGILPGCNHCFCLDCIRKWRQAKQFENKVIRACPECRVVSDFVCPSKLWVESSEEKDKLLTNYKSALSKKQCKYFQQGKGECPFGNKCFYLHALPDGTKTDVGPPHRHRRQNADGDEELTQNFTLWEYVEGWQQRWSREDDEINQLLIEYVLSLDDMSDLDDDDEDDLL